MIEEDIHRICRRYNIEDYTINVDMSIDVDNNVTFLHNEDLIELPLNFNRVERNFDCSNNKLKSLKGSPIYVGGSFNCTHNKLISLIGCPKIVKESFFCGHNKLKSLKYCPDRLNKSFECHNNNLKSLKYGPSYVYHTFDVEHNDIKTFEGLPKSNNIFLLGNPINELWDLFRNKDYIDYFNELDIIQDDGELVILERLNYFLQDIGINEEIDTLEEYFVNRD